jgi:hypothetical protein
LYNAENIVQQAKKVEALLNLNKDSGKLDIFENKDELNLQKKIDKSKENSNLDENNNNNNIAILSDNEMRNDQNLQTKHAEEVVLDSRNKVEAENKIEKYDQTSEKFQKNNVIQIDQQAVVADVNNENTATLNPQYKSAIQIGRTDKFLTKEEKEDV